MDPVRNITKEELEAAINESHKKAIEEALPLRKEYFMRFRKLITEEILLYNPYRHSDEDVAGKAYATVFNPESLTQMTVLEFTGLTEDRTYGECLLWTNCNRQHGSIPVRSILGKHTALDTSQPIRSLLDGKALTDETQVRRLTGKAVFLSHAIPALGRNGRREWALRMFRLRGEIEVDAEIIRKSMCRAKIEMLNRLLDHPECPKYIGCPKGLLEIERPIMRLISKIENFL